MTKQKAALISIFSNSALIIMKLFAGMAMFSVSVISEAIHSGIDLIASIIAFISIKKAIKPADEDHQYGHGKFENISGFVEALLIFIAALLIVYEAIKKILEKTEIHNEFAGIAVMAVSIVINIIVSSVLMKISKKTESVALEADAWHLFTDVFTSVGVLVGLILIKITGLTIIDPVIAIVVAIIIIKAAYDLTMKSLHDLVDKSLPPEELEFIKEAINRHKEIVGFHKLRTRKCGSYREIDVHLLINRNSTLVESHNLCDIIEDEIKEKLKQAHITIHIEPAVY